MHFLLLCILSSTAIFVIFKTIDRLGIPSFPVIVINYLTATILGFLINAEEVSQNSIWDANWLSLSVIIGIMFILMFFLIAFSSKKAGISVTTVASKMSVVFPIAFSMFIDSSDQLSLFKIFAIAVALCGVMLTIYTPDKGNVDRSVVFIPLLLFVGMGVVDSMVKLAQHSFVMDNNTALFSGILFLNAFLSGLVATVFYRKDNRQFLRKATWAWGLLLGTVNFGSIFFLVKALNQVSPSGKGLDGSVVFGANNISIVALSVLVGLLVFKEKLRAINWVGIALSALALLLFALV
jgi:drug/metabolite transporter (DMT)-like permease